MHCMVKKSFFYLFQPTQLTLFLDSWEKITSFSPKDEIVEIHQRDILDQNPGATWNDEHQKKYDENLAEIERIDAAIERHQKVMDLTAENNLRDAVSDVTKGDKATKDEAVRLFDKWCRGGDNALTPDEW